MTDLYDLPYGFIYKEDFNPHKDDPEGKLFTLFLENNPKEAIEFGYAKDNPITKDEIKQALEKRIKND